ncbi:MAG: hypothetical protein ACWA49_04225 [Ruegeria sp.]
MDRKPLSSVAGVLLGLLLAPPTVFCVIIVVFPVIVTYLPNQM